MHQLIVNSVTTRAYKGDQRREIGMEYDLETIESQTVLCSEQWLCMILYCEESFLRRQSSTHFEYLVLLRHVLTYEIILFIFLENNDFFSSWKRISGSLKGNNLLKYSIFKAVFLPQCWKYIWIFLFKKYLLVAISDFNWMCQFLCNQWNVKHNYAYTYWMKIHEWREFISFTKEIFGRPQKYFVK